MKFTVPVAGKYQVHGSYTINVPEGTIIDLDHVSGIGSNMFDYGDTSVGNLKCKCYVCTKEITPSQRFDYYTSKYSVTMKCCGREEVVNLTEAQIKLNNETGFYFAFMKDRL